MEELLQNIKDFLTENGLVFFKSIVLALVILIVGRWVAKLLSRLVERAMKRAKVDGMLSRFIHHLCYIGLMVLVIISALGQLGIHTASFAAILAAAGLAVGLALQGSLSNFAAGVMLLIFRPFKLGDFIDAGGQMGSVQEIQLFNTVLNTPDNVRVVVPNGQITAGTIKNYTFNETRRLDMVFGVSYSDDLKQARQIIEEILNADERVLKEPAPTIAVAELADSSANFVVRPWVKGADYWSTKFDLTEKIKNTFDQQGITIPFPQRDVHIFNTDTKQKVSA
ncbi:MAG: mechanosensitive ion channel [Sedimentisphaerales bacterium]|nr:mechanosensitive ion channel [Sedimentisphaerales bacterium]